MLAIFDEMVSKNIELNEIMWKLIIDTCLKEGNFLKALKLVDDLALKGAKVSENVYSLLVDSISEAEGVLEDFKLLDEANAQPFRLSIDTCWTLIRGLQRAQRADKAKSFLEGISRLNWVEDSTQLKDIINQDPDSSRNDGTINDLQAGNLGVSYL
ncbi:Pentatricopeptide repeat-containing protein At3g53700, chloroplastic [Linum perenne]